MSRAGDGIVVLVYMMWMYTEMDAVSHTLVRLYTLVWEQWGLACERVHVVFKYGHSLPKCRDSVRK